jgi:hypothetical protein
VSGGAAGMQQMALAMLRTLGGRRASLLVPQPATASQQTGLGLVAPMASELDMEPVLLQTWISRSQSASKLYAMMARCTVLKALNLTDGIEGVDQSVRLTLETSKLRSGGTDYRIVSVTAKWYGGTELIYQLEIEE